MGKNKKGFTLLEVLVAISLFAGMLAAVSGIFGGFIKNYTATKEVQKNLENAQFAMNTVAKVLRTSSVLSVASANFSQTPSINDLMAYDYSQQKCVRFQYAGTGVQVNYSTSAVTKIEDCFLGGTTWSGFNMLTTGNVTGNFAYASSSNNDTGAANPFQVGRLTIFMNVKKNATSNDVASLQTTVSFRDYSKTSVPPSLAEPIASPDGGAYAAAQSVTLTTATVGATIRYTTNGTDPTATSALYAGPIAVNATTTIKAISTMTGMSNSDIMVETYTINSVAATPTASPVGGAFSSAQTVTLSTATAGATIRYTTNGTNPTATSTLYAGPIMVSATTTIKAIAIKAGMTNSAVMSETYTICTFALPFDFGTCGTFPITF